MPSRRVILLVLDGYDPALGERMADAGAMPALQRLRARAARFDLDHGTARWTGLAGEHISTGLSPAAANRFAAVQFDPKRYAVRQPTTSSTPFPALLPVRTVVFNPTYFDLARAPAVQGVVGWGGVHDGGAASFSRPDGLAAEIEARFGGDPSEDWTYSVVWPSAERTRQMAGALREALALKARIIPWLLHDRLPDWDLAIVGVGEVHSALEAMWHGIDPAHPLHPMPSAEFAGKGLLAVYGAVDMLIGTIADAFPGAALVATSLHGMGPNASDIAGMALLPELLYRRETGRRRLAGAPPGEEAAMPILPENGDWTGVLRQAYAAGDDGRDNSFGRRVLQFLRPRHDPVPGDDTLSGDPAVDWMPATWYRRHWPKMAAFALPAYYDGRIRLNLAGRESRGRIAPKDHGAACDAIEALLRECRDVHTGAPVVASIERVPASRAQSLDITEVDLIVRWTGMPTGFAHPTLGRIGPFPRKRVGGHTGGHGVAYIAAAGTTPAGSGAGTGVRSAFDVVPTVIELLGVAKPPGLSGASLLAASQ